MNGPHDLGGKHGFGAIDRELKEPVFHANWEARVFGVSMALGKHCPWTLDEDRHTCENQSPRDYYSQSYYETWLHTMEKLVDHHGMKNVTRMAEPGLTVAEIPSVLAERSGYIRTVPNKATFAIGEHVRLRNLQPRGHTRLPAYLRGHVGKIVAAHGAHVFPDSNAHGHGENPQWLYSVQFQAKEVWGKPSKDLIHADLWEPYLEPV